MKYLILVLVALAACTPAQHEQAKDAARAAAEDARKKLNEYCDARAKVIDTLGAAGAPASAGGRASVE
jgi:hypothetical protein